MDKLRLIKAADMNRQFQRGDEILKRTGDYHFRGIVVAVFQKRSDGERSGLLRVVAENDCGLLFVFAPSQLELVESPNVP